MNHLAYGACYFKPWHRKKEIVSKSRLIEYLTRFIDVNRIRKKKKTIQLQLQLHDLIRMNPEKVNDVVPNSNSHDKAIKLNRIWNKEEHKMYKY